MTQPSGSKAERHPATRSPVWLPMLLGCGALVFMLLRIRTFVTGQDPFWYIALARQVLEGRTLADELAPGLAFVAPGYPLILALSISLFGPFAPYGVNVVFGIVFVCVLVVLSRRVYGPGSSPTIVLFATLYVVVSGYDLNAHFLLYPFRGMPIYALMFLGFLLIHAAGDTRGGAGLAVASGTCFLAAIGIREPAVFG